MQQEQQLQPFGYAEMFEWKVIPDNLKNNGTGIFVQFSESEPDKIEPYHGGVTVGVTTSNFCSLSDNPIEWPGKYKTNETGGYVKEKKYIAVGNKVYDQQQEINIVRTFPYKIYKKQESDSYDTTKGEYIPRINRIEWVPVCTHGKTLVYDDGTCEAGKYCTPKISDDFTTAGYVTKSEEGFYVMKRVSDNVVLILI